MEKPILKNEIKAEIKGFSKVEDNISDAKMEKTDLGFQIEVELISSDTFNFCFYKTVLSFQFLIEKLIND